MKFQKNTRRPALEYEKDLVRYWREQRTFEKSVDQRPKENGYVFYDGPPFITGVPHHGTLLSSIVKDAVPRYWTMKGKRVERVWGWDCHGLPAEVYTEKKLGIKDKTEIGTKISLEDYIKACRDNMVLTGNLWEDTIARIGRWVDFQGAYKTMDKPYMESVWWAFKQLFDKGKIYEGEKVLLYCTRDETPLAKAEIAMDNSYQEDTDPSVYVKFKLVGEAKYLLAWTTTPWTLPSNSAIAINKEVEYAEVDVDGTTLILAKELLERVLTDEKHNVVPFKIIRTFQGSELVGKSYEPLFDTYKDVGDTAFKVWHADFVHTEEGTGIAHESPAYGEDDYLLAQRHKIPMFIDTDEKGLYTKGEWKGQLVWDINKEIARTLHQRGVVWKIEYITHPYPHCHRCNTKLMYRAHPSWFMDIEGQRSTMLSKNEPITWFPAHIKHGRFEKTVENAPDWNLSRDRFWATAMPIWKAVDREGKEHVKVIGSYAELKELSGVELEDYHRPWIDDVTFTIDGLEYKRIDKVMDSWFEAGSMPFAQFHYPFENREKFEQSFPGDFIAEYVAQVRAWFYYLHAVGVGLFDNNSFKNVIVTGTIAGNDGRKMSKSYGNYTDPNELMDEYSADALRFLLLSSPLLNGEDYSLQDKDVADVFRKLNMVWNMYDFFTLYASVDGWEWDGTLDDPLKTLSNPLDRWIISRVHSLTAEVQKSMDSYDIPNALKPVLPFLDDASNWFVRRSRRRFWKPWSMHRADQSSGQATRLDDTSGAGSGLSSPMLSSSSSPTPTSASRGEDHSDAQMQAQGHPIFDSDKDDAYRTLHYVLVRLSMILAPFTPFMAEELYRKLTGGESVHLLDWPPSGEVDKDLLYQMAAIRHVVAIGLGLRAEQGVKVRQPLAKATLRGTYKDFPADLLEIVKDELNVKELVIDEKHVDPEKTFGQNWEEHNFAQLYQIEIDFNVTEELREEGIMRELVRSVQNARKQAGLNVEDRIALLIETDSIEIQQAIENHQATILSETLTEEFGEVSADAYRTTVKVEGLEVKIAVAKV